MWWGLVNVILILSFNISAFTLDCHGVKNRINLKFYLIKKFQRSLGEKLHIDNVDSLESCMEMARNHKGLALNYRANDGSVKTNEEYIGKTAKNTRDHYWLQPQLYFNCHILRCPENSSFKTLINDTSFDYYSLYEDPMDPSDYICLPEIGLFVLNIMQQNFKNASFNCRNSTKYCGSLAHVASRKRTLSLTQLILDHNQQQMQQNLKSNIQLAYVGLHFNRSWSLQFDIFNSEMENIKCFPYRAWEPGSPKRSSHFVNSSCVALTTRGTWKTVDCRRKLPYICEVFTTCF